MDTYIKKIRLTFKCVVDMFLILIINRIIIYIIAHMMTVTVPFELFSSVTTLNNDYYFSYSLLSRLSSTNFPISSILILTRTCSFVDIVQWLNVSMYFNYFSSVPKRLGTTNFTSTTYLSCFKSRLSLELFFCDSSSECTLFFVAVLCLWVYSLVGVNPFTAWGSGSTSINPYYSLLSLDVNLGIFFRNLLIVSSLSSQSFNSNFSTISSS